MKLVFELMHSVKSVALPSVGGSEQNKNQSKGEFVPLQPICAGLIIFWPWIGIYSTDFPGS